ncbi:MAG: response regulator [Betaproteobacteria bacterium]
MTNPARRSIGPRAGETLATGQPADRRAEQPAREPTEPKPDPLESAILIVDDDPRSRMALRELLQAPGCVAVVAESGDEALRWLLKRDFAAILLDVQMPGLNGFETARMIRERERSRHTPIIFLTGTHEDLESVFRGYEAGAVDYIVKPPNTDVLRSKVEVFVDLFNKNAELRREVAERKLAVEQLRASEENLRGLAVRLHSVREEERARISREIHDELGQELTGLKIELSWIASRLPKDLGALVEKAKSTLGLIDDTIESVRKIAAGLRPAVSDQLGLAGAIEWQVKDFRKRTGIRCKLSLPGELPAFDPEQATAMFRICQELLTNVARHAAASRVEVALHLESARLVLSVEDNGRGLGEVRLFGLQSLGFLGMQERLRPYGGKIEIDSTGGKGARITATLPLDHGRAPA